MKNNILNKLLVNTPKQVDYDKKEVYISIDYKGSYIISKVNVKNDLYKIETNVNLRETQEDNVINYLTELWHQHFSNSFNGSTITQDDKIHAIELLYKN